MPIAEEFKSDKFNSLEKEIDSIYSQKKGALTKAGEALKEKAIAVPEEMQGCIPLSKAELKQLKLLLDSALLKMNGIEQEEEKCMKTLMSTVDAPLIAVFHW